MSDKVVIRVTLDVFTEDSIAGEPSEVLRFTMSNQKGDASVPIAACVADVLNAAMYAWADATHSSDFLVPLLRRLDVGTWSVRLSKLVQAWIDDSTDETFDEWMCRHISEPKSKEPA